jgi:tRNA pseudouridine38-40 synthase
MQPWQSFWLLKDGYQRHPGIGDYQVGQDLSARYQAYERCYKYILTKDRNPFNRHWAGYIPHLKIRLQPMLEAAFHLLGQHDFSSFGASIPR